MLREGSCLIRHIQLGTQSLPIARHRLSCNSNATNALFGRPPRYSAAVAEPVETTPDDTGPVSYQPPDRPKFYPRAQRFRAKPSPPVLLQTPENESPPYVIEDTMKPSIGRKEPNSSPFEASFSHSTSSKTAAPAPNNAQDQIPDPEGLPQISPETVLPPTPEPSGASPTPTQETRLSQAAQSRRYNRALRKLDEISNRDEGKDQLPPHGARIATPIIKVYLDALRHLGRTRNVQDAVRHLQSFPDQTPTKESYAVLLRKYLESLNLLKARLLVCEMMALGIQLDRDIVKLILHGERRWAVSLDSIDALLDLLTSKPRDLSLSYIITKFSFDSIDSLLDMLNSESRDMGIYNIIITAYLRRGRPDKARIVIDKTLKIGLHPNGNTFYALMQYQAAKEGSRGVSVILNSMKKAGYVAEAKHLNLLISYLARQEPVDLNSVATLFSSHNIKPDKATCNIVLRSLLRRKFDSQQIEAHFQEMGRLGLDADVYTYTILLNEYKYKSIPWHRMREFLEIQSDLNPSNVNQVAVNTILHRMIATFHRPPNRKRPTPSFDSFPSDIDLPWDAHTLTSLVTAYLRSRDWSKIVSLHRELLKRQVKLDRYFYRVMLKALLDGKLYSEATEVTSLLFDSDDIVDQIFGRECELRIAHSLFRNTRQGKDRVVQAVDRLLKFSDEKSIIISEKLCNLIGIAFLDICLEPITVQLLESRYHKVGRFQDLEQGQRLGMSAWVVLMRAYSRFGANGVKQLRSCVQRALADEATTPTSTFLKFLERIGRHPKLRRRCERDCNFFLWTRLKYIWKPKPAPNHKGRSYLTKTSILRWTTVRNSGTK